MMFTVVIVLNGVLVASAPPPRLLFGHVVVAVSGVIAQIAQRVSVTGDGITLERGTQRCRFRIGTSTYTCHGTSTTAAVTPFAHDGIAYLPLADVARALGAQVRYDARRGIVALTFPEPVPFGAPSVFDAAAPRVAPTQIFTPQPPPPAPRVDATGEPRPRRTAIPVTPSRVPI